MEYDFSRFTLSLKARLVLAAGLFAVGAVLQIVFHWGFIPGLIAVVAGYFPLMLKKVTNKPKDQGLEEWRPVSMAEVDKLSDTLRESKAMRNKGMGSMALTIAISAVSLIAAGVSASINQNVALAIFDGWLFAVPALFFGRTKAFVPVELSMKMPCYQAIFSEQAPEDIIVTPYLRFDKDEQGRDVPEDIRLMVEPRRKPQDFVGVQIQTAINKGPNGPVPYMYAVILTHGKGETWQRFRGLRSDDYEVEPGGDEEYGTVVIRQETGGGGYQTKPSDCAQLYRDIIPWLRPRLSA